MFANVFLRFAICILRFDEFPIPDCTIAKQRFLFFCILHLCIYAFDESLGLRGVSIDKDTFQKIVRLSGSLRAPWQAGRPMVHMLRSHLFFGEHLRITSPAKRYLARAALMALGRRAAWNQTEGKLRSGLCGPRGPVRPARLRGFRFAGSRPKTRGSLRQSEAGSASVSRALDSELEALHGRT